MTLLDVLGIETKGMECMAKENENKPFYCLYCKQMAHITDKQHPQLTPI